jgi:hypothetical protein
MVRSEFRPTLREELAGRPRLRWVAVAAGSVALACAAWLVWHVLHPGIAVSRTRPLAYHFRRPASLRERPPGAGELVRLEQRRHGRVVNAFVVSPLRLPPYSGDAAGVLPLVAARDLAALRARFPGLQLGFESFAKLAGMPGHQLSFRIRGRPRMYGRELLLPRPAPGARDGVRLLLLAAASAAVASAGDVGVHGALRLPYRSFRFG